MLSNLIDAVKSAFTPQSEQETLDAYIAAQHPTSVYDVEYWMNEYDRKQRTTALSANFNYHYR